MLRPRIPTNPAPTGTVYPIHTPNATAAVAPVPVQDAHVPACGCQHTPAPTVPALVQQVARPVVQLTPGAVVAGVAVVLVVGTVLVSLLLAVAVTAASVAVCAVVLALLLRWLRENGHAHR